MNISYAKEIAQEGDVHWAERWETFLVKAPSLDDAAKVLRDMCGVSPPKPNVESESAPTAVDGESLTKKDEAKTAKTETDQVKQARTWYSIR